MSALTSASISPKLAGLAATLACTLISVSAAKYRAIVAILAVAFLDRCERVSLSRGAVALFQLCTP